MFRKLTAWQKRLYLDICDWYAPALAQNVTNKVAVDPLYSLVSQAQPMMWDITPEVDLPKIQGRTKETNIFTLDQAYAPLSKVFKSTISSGATSTTQALSSVAGLAIGDALCFPGQPNAYLSITAISGNNVTLSGSVATTTGQNVFVPQVLDGWAMIVKSPGNALYDGVWYVQGDPQIFEHQLPHQALLLKRGNVTRGMPLT